jgi:hypothetical protein
MKLLVFTFLVVMFLNPITSGKKTVTQNLNEYERPFDSSTFGVDYLIITSVEFEDEMEALAELKVQKGIPTKILTVSNIVGSYSGEDYPEKIKNCIIEYELLYDLDYVLLAGDYIDVPTREVIIPELYETVSCDSYYADLNNDWNLDNDNDWADEDDSFDFDAEVYVGRIPANTEAEMRKLVNNIINYETNPPAGDWMKNTLYAGAFITCDTDWDNDGEPEYLKGDENRFHHFVADSLEDTADYEWNEYYLAETEGLVTTEYPYNDSLNKENVLTALEEGYGFGIITGHGNPNRMVQLIFNNDHDADGCVDYTGDFIYDDSALQNPEGQTSTIPFIETGDIINQPEPKLGLYLSGGCSIATFTSPNDCLAEKLLKTCSIGVVGASQNVWGEDEWTEREHGGWFAQGIQFRFLEQLVQNNHPGQALAKAKADYVNDRANYVEFPRFGPFPEYDERCLKQYNLLGDPEVPIWMDVPKNLSVVNETTIDGLNLIVKDRDSINNPLEDVLCSLTKGTNLIWKDFTNSDGEILIPYNSTEIEEYTLTIFEEGYLPQIKIGIPEEDSPAPPINDDDDGDSFIPGFAPSFMVLSSLVGISFIISWNTKKPGKKLNEIAK